MLGRCLGRFLLVERLRKEGNCMGVIVRQKKKGKGNPWWIFISHNGKRTSRKVGYRTAAEKTASTIRSKLQLGEFNLKVEKKSIPTLKLYAERYMDTYSAMNHKPSTHDSYRSRR